MVQLRFISFASACVMGFLISMSEKSLAAETCTSDPDCLQQAKDLLAYCPPEEERIRSIYCTSDAYTCLPEKTHLITYINDSCTVFENLKLIDHVYGGDLYMPVCHQFFTNPGRVSDRDDCEAIYQAALGGTQPEEPPAETDLPPVDTENSCSVTTHSFVDISFLSLEPHFI